MIDMIINKGDTFPFTVKYRYKGETDYIIMNGKLLFTVKKDLGDTDTEAVIKAEINVTAATEGVFELTPTQTNISAGVYNYDVKYISVANKVTTIKVGKLQINATVTERS